MGYGRIASDDANAYGDQLSGECQVPVDRVQHQYIQLMTTQGDVDLLNASRQVLATKKSITDVNVTHVYDAWISLRGSTSPFKRFRGTNYVRKRRKFMTNFSISQRFVLHKGQATSTVSPEQSNKGHIGSLKTTNYV